MISTSGHHSEPLASGWELCSTAPGAIADARALAAASPTLSWTSATVPSTAASALRAAGKFDLDGPSRRFDAEEIWYRAKVTVAPAEPGETVALVCEGLATVADVYWNGELLFTSESMFVAHDYALDDVLRAAKTTEHEIVIRFRSLDALLAGRRPRPRWRAPMIENQQLRFFRTTLLGRTPGWSPPAAAVGPWRPIRIERRRAVVVSDVSLVPTVHDGRGTLEVACTVRALGATTKQGVEHVEVVLEHAQETTVGRLTRDGDGTSFRGTVEVAAAHLWWPHTHGEPNLYHARIRVGGAHGPPLAEVDLGKVGFRSIALDTQDGGFTLRVNGARIFCRGACFTPLDVVSLASTRDEIRAAVQQARAAGMNMLRASGTMVYESDDFFDACDELGVLVWQDFMFANMDYPAEDPTFARLVRTEAQQFLARVQARPALGILCGNSEGEQQAAMWGAARELWSPSLFHETLATASKELCPDVPYWPSSAHGGAFPHQPNAGSSSYYGVGAYLRPLEDARRSDVRFASECLAFANVPEPRGIAAMPGGETLKVHHPGWKARTPRDLGAGWDFDDVRDFYLKLLYGVDPLELRYGDHERYLALGRVVTGEVMAAAFGEWRRSKSVCGGGIVWFLRDLWPGAGWGVVDASGRPKAAYYMLRRALAPVTTFVTDEGTSGLALHIVNETARSVEAVLRIALYRSGDVLVGKGEQRITLDARAVIERSAAALFEGFFDTSYAYRFGPPSHEVALVTLARATDGAVLAEAAHFPGGRALVREADVGLVAEAAAGPEGTLTVTVRTRAFAQNVHVELDGWIPDDDYFHLGPGAARVVTLRRGAGKAALRGSVSAINSAAAAKLSVPT